jgi:hypothetical protein
MPNTISGLGSFLGAGSISAPDKVYSLGETGPAGGIIFYDAGSNLSWGRYMEIAPNNWQGSGSDQAAWKGTNPQYSGVSGTTSTAIGTGYTNTVTNYLWNNNQVQDNAHKVCRLYTGGGKTDWFLPSLDELTQVYTRRALIPGIRTSSGYSYTGYWSSTEWNADYALNRRFDDGYSPNQELKIRDWIYFRPVRYV